MKFGPVNVQEAEGAILAHSLTLHNGQRIRKGALIDALLVDELIAAGITEIIVARAEANEIGEDIAASEIASAIKGENFRTDTAKTGRVNFFATADGLFQVSRELINAVNKIDPAITIATLDNYSKVNSGRIIATIKIIPYAVSKKSLDAVLNLELSNAFEVSRFSGKKVHLVSTQLPSLKPSVMDKTRANLERRLHSGNAHLIDELRIPHTLAAIENGITSKIDDCDLLILFGASAISDPHDLIPQAIINAGGEIIRFGMPVDPGNLLLLGLLKGKTIIGAPGCARSIAENGFDWVLNRVLSDIPVNASDIASLGVGGLLMETGSRPHARIQTDKVKHHIAALILAAGQSRRMGETNKMTVSVNDKPMLAHVVEAATASKATSVTVVSGYEPEAVRKIIEDHDVSEVHNSDYAEGLSTSLATGISTMGQEVSAAIILLGDMPFVTSDMIDQIIMASQENPGHIIMATHEGKRGNPVLWPARFFEELRFVSGDVGARHIIGANSDFVIEIELGIAASLDLDTPEAVASIMLNN